MNKAEQKAFYKGFACALATLIRWHDQPSVAVDVARVNGLDLKDFSNAEIDPDDLEVITKAYKR